MGDGWESLRDGMDERPGRTGPLARVGGNGWPCHTSGCQREQPFSGPGPDKKDVGAGGTDMPTRKCPPTIKRMPDPSQTLALLWNILSKGITAAALASLPMCLPALCSSSLASPYFPKASLDPCPQSLIGAGVVSLGLTWLRALCLCPWLTLSIHVILILASP